MRTYYTETKRIDIETIVETKQNINFLLAATVHVFVCDLGLKHTLQAQVVVQGWQILILQTANICKYETLAFLGASS